MSNVEVFLTLTALAVMCGWVGYLFGRLSKTADESFEEFKIPLPEEQTTYRHFWECGVMTKDRALLNYENLVDRQEDCIDECVRELNRIQDEVNYYAVEKSAFGTIYGLRSRVRLPLFPPPLPTPEPLTKEDVVDAVGIALEKKTKKTAKKTTKK